MVARLTTNVTEQDRRDHPLQLQQWAVYDMRAAPYERRPIRVTIYRGCCWVLLKLHQLLAVGPTARRKHTTFLDLAFRADGGSRTWGKKRGRLPLEKQIGPRSATKPGRQKIPTFRRLLATGAPLPACPRTAALRLALCPSFSRVSPFTFMLTPAHLPAFHSHFLTAQNTGTEFLKLFLWITFLLFCLSHCIQYRHCISQFSAVPLTMEPSQEPSFLSLMMMGSSSSLPLFTLPHTALPAPPKSTRDWKMILQHCWWICLRRSFLPIAWTAWHSSNGKKFYRRLRRHFHSLGLKFRPKYTKWRRNLIRWNRSMENLTQFNGNGHGLSHV